MRDHYIVLFSLYSILFGFGASVAAPYRSVAPQPSTSIFSTLEYGLTFDFPKGSTYCNVSESPQITIQSAGFFLATPKLCAEIERPWPHIIYKPANIARFQVMYHYWMGDETTHAHKRRCRKLDDIVFLGYTRQICEINKGSMIGATIEGRYRIDADEDQGAVAYFTLLTTPDRFAADLETFKRLLRSARTCSSRWSDDGKSSHFTVGSGAPCPTNGLVF